MWAREMVVVVVAAAKQQQHQQQQIGEAWIELDRKLEIDPRMALGLTLATERPRLMPPVTSNQSLTLRSMSTSHRPKSRGSTNQIRRTTQKKRNGLQSPARANRKNRPFGRTIQIGQNRRDSQSSKNQHRPMIAPNPLNNRHLSIHPP